LLSVLLLSFEFIDLFGHRVIREFSQKHLLLLIDKLVDVLGPLLPRELYTSTSQVHGRADQGGVGLVIIRKFDFVIGCHDVSVLYSAKRSSAVCCVFVPDLKVFGLLLGFLFLLFLSFACYEDFFVVRRPEGRAVFVEATLSGHGSYCWITVHIYLCN